MALDDDIRILSGVGLFEGFNREQLRLMAFGAEPIHLVQGRRLYLEDDQADSAYVVVAGAVRLYREQDGRRQAITDVGPGAILGELALIADTRRLTSADALSDSELLRINRPMFRRILEEYPELAMVLHKRISDELQAMVRRIEKVAARFEP